MASGVDGATEASKRVADHTNGHAHENTRGNTGIRPVAAGRETSRGLYGTFRGHRPGAGAADVSSLSRSCVPGAWVELRCGRAYVWRRQPRFLPPTQTASPSGHALTSSAVCLLCRTGLEAKRHDLPCTGIRHRLQGCTRLSAQPHSEGMPACLRSKQGVLGATCLVAVVSLDFALAAFDWKRHGFRALASSLVIAVIAGDSVPFRSPLGCGIRAVGPYHGLSDCGRSLAKRAAHLGLRYRVGGPLARGGLKFGAPFQAKWCDTSTASSDVRVDQLRRRSRTSCGQAVETWRTSSTFAELRCHCQVVRGLWRVAPASVAKTTASGWPARLGSWVSAPLVWGLSTDSCIGGPFRWAGEGHLPWVLEGGTAARPAFARAAFAGACGRVAGVVSHLCLQAVPCFFGRMRKGHSRTRTCFVPCHPSYSFVAEQARWCAPKTCVFLHRPEGFGRML